MYHDGLMSKDGTTGDQTYDCYDKTPICKLCYISSVNRWNHTSPIVKTASQTMKITYTLTDVEEEEENNG